MVADMIQTGHFTLANLLTFVGFAGAGFVAWRTQRGSFYKELADELKEKIEKTEKRNQELERQRDLTPIIDTLGSVAAQLGLVAETNEKVFSKVVEMNGALRHHAEAMKALADRIILDEAARGLLITAAERKDPS